jgi:hypothetical protein
MLLITYLLCKINGIGDKALLSAYQNLIDMLDLAKLS